MRSKSARCLCLLATTIVLAASDTPFPSVTLAQIPEAPGTFSNSSGARTQQAPVDPGPRGESGVWLRSDQSAPDSAREIIDEMEKARARAGGTPVPRGTPQDFTDTP